MRRKDGTRLAPSAAVENFLYDEVRPLIEAMFDTTDRAIRRERIHAVRQPTMDTFRRRSRAITRDFINRVVNHTRLAFKGATRGFYTRPKDVLTDRRSVQRVEKCWQSTESMIQDVPKLFFRKLDEAVRRFNDGDMTGNAFDARYVELKRQTLVRMRLIARNENSRATEALLVSRCSESGLKYVKWCHTDMHEKEPREYHLRRWDGHTGKRNGKPNGLNGYIFEIGNPPVIDRKTGERGYPAQLINCKCYLVPVEGYS